MSETKTINDPEVIVSEKLDELVNFRKTNESMPILGQTI